MTDASYWITTDTARFKPGFLDAIVRQWTRASALGNLHDTPLPDSALELRFWAVGWASVHGLVLARSAHGAWTARKVVIRPCAMIVAVRGLGGATVSDSIVRSCEPRTADGGSGRPGDLLAVLPVELPANPDSVWREVEATGVPHAPSTFIRPERLLQMLDVALLSLELRLGERYSFFEIARDLPFEHSTISAVNRTYDILSRAYRWR